MRLVILLMALVTLAACGRSQDPGTTIASHQGAAPYYDKHFRNIALEQSASADSPKLFLVRKPCGCNYWEKASVVQANVSCNGPVGSSRAVPYYVKYVGDEQTFVDEAAGAHGVWGVKAVCQYASNPIPSQRPTVDLTCRCTGT